MNAETFKGGGGVCFAALVPHAPILVPAAARETPKPAAASLAALDNVAARLTGRRLDAVIVFSPHSPRRPGAVGVSGGNRLCGDLTQFGAPQVTVDLPSDRALVDEIKVQASLVGLQTWEIPVQTLDHGVLVVRAD